MTLYLVTGGARSGKSRFAERFAEQLADQYGGDAHGGFAGKLVYVATMQAHDDDELAERIRRHRSRRSPAWETVEEPYDPETLVQRAGTRSETPVVLLMDCVTLWVSNLLLQPDGEGRERWMDSAYRDGLAERAAKLARTAAGSPWPIILVTNEVGDSLVPEYPLGRAFRDLAGRVNQLLAECAEEVYLTVCGIPVPLRAVSTWPGAPGR